MQSIGEKMKNGGFRQPIPELGFGGGGGQFGENGATASCSLSADKVNGMARIFLMIFGLTFLEMNIETVIGKLSMFYMCED